MNVTFMTRRDKSRKKRPSLSSKKGSRKKSTPMLPAWFQPFLLAGVATTVLAVTVLWIVRKKRISLEDAEIADDSLSELKAVIQELNHSKKLLINDEASLLH